VPGCLYVSNLVSLRLRLGAIAYLPGCGAKALDWLICAALVFQDLIHGLTDNSQTYSESLLVKTAFLCPLNSIAMRYCIQRSTAHLVVKSALKKKQSEKLES